MTSASTGAAGTGMGAGEDRRLRDDLETLKADFSALRDDLRVFARDAAAAGKTVAGDAADRLRQRGRVVWDAARDKSKATTEQMGQQIEEHPFAAVGIAFGVGLLVGAIIARR